MDIFGGIAIVVNDSLEVGHVKLFKGGKFIMTISLKKVQDYLPDCDKIELSELDYADLKRVIKLQS